VGSIRQRHLIRLLSVLVALNLAAGLTVVYAHATGAAADAKEQRAPLTPAAGPAATGGSPTTTSGPSAGGALAAGHFSHHRGSGTTSSTAVPGPAGGGGPTTTAPAVPAGPTNASGPAPVATTGPPPAETATPSTTGPPTPATTAGSRLVTDPAGDTFVSDSRKPITEPRADIVSAGATYAPGGVTFTLQVRQPDDPRTDPKWASDATYIAWDVDTNGDGRPDFEVQYSWDGKEFGGSVIHPGDDDSVPDVCEATSAGYGAAGYSVTIDPACLGNPAALSFSATTYYDTNPKDDNAPVASDVAPDGGMSFPVTRP